jgi:UDP-N-acetylmuramate dehydrogenase
MKNKIQKIINKCLDESPCKVDVRYNEPMKEHTTFKVGGTADCWVCPTGEDFPKFCIELISRARKEDIPFFVLGGGANIVVSDRGIRGITLDMNEWKGEIERNINIDKGELVLKSGTSIDEAVEIAAATGFSGIEFMAGMPGTVGGAVWMNARCYGSETANVLCWADILNSGQITFNSESRKNREYVLKRIENKEGAGFGYKKSPFQEMDCLIISAAFKIKPNSRKEKIYAEMKKNRQDREEKGHYRFPCAGSAFKNNRGFGKPTGVIIDELGLKGLKIGGAQVAPFHGNIIINTGNASASDIRALTDEVAAKIKAAAGFAPEPEILFVGDWN